MFIQLVHGTREEKVRERIGRTTRGGLNPTLTRALAPTPLPNLTLHLAHALIVPDPRWRVWADGYLPRVC